jgi:hypothetical protein
MLKSRTAFCRTPLYIGAKTAVHGGIRLKALGIGMQSACVIPVGLKMERREGLCGSCGRRSAGRTGARDGFRIRESASGRLRAFKKSGYKISIDMSSK